MNIVFCRRGRWALSILSFCAVLAVLPVEAHARHSEAWARAHFAAAERLREGLNGRPPAERTRHDYQRVLNAYRLVYRGAPASSKADPSVVAVAETLVEMGRRFDDDRILHEAIDQYKFLRREYPGSKYRFEALFTIGEIYQDDLNDSEAACGAFQEFLRRYPHNHLAEDARQAVAALTQPVAAVAGDSKTSPRKYSERARNEKGSDAGKQGTKAEISEKIDSGDPESESEDQPDKALLPTAASEDQASEPAGFRPDHLARVTGIRHWSTPGYTRVAIDVESDVKFTSERIPHPARIYFDLSDTRLASTLVGKSFDVDDVFLKKIRVAQFAPKRTRVVLEVDSLSDYEAFLLPNPSRLIIDIHGRNGRGKSPREAGDNDHQAQPAQKIEPENKPSSDNTDEAVALAAAAGHLKATRTNGSEGEHTPADVIVRKADASMVAGLNPKSAKNVKRIVEADDDDSETSPAQISSPAQPAWQKHDSARELSHDPNASAADSKLAETAHADSDDSAEAPEPKQSPSRRRQEAPEFPGREAKPTVEGERSLIRALGLKIGKIVIDPGHGGHDTGTIGVNGLEEKDIVLDVGRRLGKLLEARLGAEVVYTRKDDTFIPLETRTAIANQSRADLFISIHANSSHDPDARGVETYYLNFTSSAAALEVAARENAVSEASIYELQDLVKKIALKEKIEESREFAWDVQESLHTGLATKSPAIRDRGVKKAPFIVLIGANMPSILAEISFVSNPTDARRLSTGEYRQRIAESLYRGIARYANGLSGVKVASKLDKALAR